MILQIRSKITALILINFSINLGTIHQNHFTKILIAIWRVIHKSKSDRAHFVGVSFDSRLLLPTFVVCKVYHNRPGNQHDLGMLFNECDSLDFIYTTVTWLLWHVRLAIEIITVSNSVSLENCSNHSTYERTHMYHVLNCRLRRTFAF